MRVSLSNDNGETLWNERRTAIILPSSVDDDVFAFSPNVDLDRYDAFSFQYGLANSHIFEGFDKAGFSFPRVLPYTDPIELMPGVILINACTTNGLILDHPDGNIMVEAFGSQYQSIAFI